MTAWIGALSCCLSLIHGSSAIESTAAVHAAPHAGPIQRMALSEQTLATLRAETRWTGRAAQDSSLDKGSWMERHPIWTGALIGSAAGFLISYAATYDEGSFPVHPAMASLIWGGGIGAGVGAIIGLGIARNR